MTVGETIPRAPALADDPGRLNAEAGIRASEPLHAGVRKNPEGRTPRSATLICVRVSG